MKLSKLVLILGIIVAIGSFFIFDLSDYLSLSYLKARQDQLLAFYQNNQLLTIFSYFTIYVLVAATSIPGAAVLTLMAGALFGIGKGTLIVSFASTIGASLAFLISRFFLKETIQQKFSSQLKKINKEMQKEGVLYLFTLRLLPIFPFWLINLLMGLMPISLSRFFFASQLGMLPGTFVYVNAGLQLSEIESLNDILSLELIFSFALLGLFPLIAKKILNFIKARKVYKAYKKPKKTDYNIIAIGAGAGGLVTSYIAAAVKAKVLLIEKHKMGGDCLNTGCVPSKALIRSAKMMNYAKRAKEFGFISNEVKFNFSEVMERVQGIIKKIEPHDSVERYSRLGVECLQGTATIKSPWEVEVDGKVYTTQNIVIATGASPFVPPIPGIEKVQIRTSDNIWEIREQPKKMLVLGGGPIGCELAQSFQRLGTQVTQVEMGKRILPREDAEVADYVIKQMQKDGVEILHEHKSSRFEIEDGKKYLVVESQGSEKKLEFDEILISTGRKANVKGFGLENLNVKLSERGTIEADEFLRTNYPNIFVCGDVTGPYQFTHTAAHQAWFTAVNALFGGFKKFPVDYSVIPWCTYTDPEVAQVGLNESMAKDQDIDYEVTTYGIDDLDRAIADSEDKGVVKVLTVPGKDKIIGVTIVGHHAGDLIAEFVLAMKHNLGLNKILGTIHIYPTLAEANKYAAGEWKRAHVPKKLLTFVEKFHAWKRG